MYQARPELPLKRHTYLGSAQVNTAEADFIRTVKAQVARNDAAGFVRGYVGYVSRETLKVVLVAFFALCVVAVVVAVA